MAGRKRKRLLLDLTLRPLSSESQTTPTSPSPTDSSATPPNVVGDQTIPSLAAVSGPEVNNDTESPIPSPQGLPKHKVPEGFFLLFGKLYPLPPTLQSRRSPPPPTDTTATSSRLVADQPIPVASPVNGPQDNDNPPQPPAPRPNAPVRVETWEANLWFPGVRVPGRPTLGMSIHLGHYGTQQEAQDVHDRAALKFFETKGVVTALNSHASRHAEFMEEHKDWSLRDLVWQFRRHSLRFTKGSSSMKGVSIKKKANGITFRAQIAYKASSEEELVQYCLGRFESEEEAGKAYDRALLYLHHEDTEEQKLHVCTNFRPSTYSDSEILGPGKDSVSGSRRVLPKRLSLSN